MRIKKDYIGFKFHGWEVVGEVERTWSHQNRKFIISDGNQTKNVWLNQLTSSSSSNMPKVPKSKKEKKIKKSDLELTIDENFDGPEWLTQDFTNEITSKVTELKIILPKLSIKGDILEEVVREVLSKQFPNSNNNHGRHSQGGDVNVDGSEDSWDNPNIKSGTIDTNGDLTISSHRLTTHVTEELNTTEEGKMTNLENILSHLSGKTVPYLAFPECKSDGKKYICWVELDFSQLSNYEWQILWGKKRKSKGQFQGFEGISPDGKITLSIYQSMSYQLWIKLSRENYKIFNKLSLHQNSNVAE
jgi:hypothetical protein